MTVCVSQGMLKTFDERENTTLQGIRNKLRATIRHGRSGGGPLFNLETLKLSRKSFPGITRRAFFARFKSKWRGPKVLKINRKMTIFVKFM